MGNLPLNKIMMNELKKYWRIYLITLFAYIAYNIIYIQHEHTFPKDLKIVITAGCMVFLTVASIVAIWSTKSKWWTILFLWLFSLSFWAFSVDGILALWFHANPLYMSVGTWPDKQILTVVNSGGLYFVAKCTVMLVSAGGFVYMEKDDIFPVKTNITDSQRRKRIRMFCGLVFILIIVIAVLSS